VCRAYKASILLTPRSLSWKDKISLSNELPQRLDSDFFCQKEKVVLY